MIFDSTILFPETVPSERSLFPLVLVFHEIVYCLPVESETGSQSAVSPVEEMTERSWCRLVTPAPLGGDRDRFCRLLTEIREHRDDYGARFRDLSLAGLSGPGRAAAETKSSIVAGLLRQRGIGGKSDQPRSMRLWQDRLFLKLAELHDAEQEGLQNDLQRLAEKEEKMLAELRRETDTPGSGKFSAPTPGPRQDMTRQRLKAWAGLLLAGNNPFDGDDPVLVTRSTDADEMLREAYLRQTGRSPLASGLITLPARGPSSGLVASVNAFRQEAEDLVRELGAILHRGEYISGISGEKWEGLVERFFPAATCGRSTLTLTGYPGCTAAELLAEAFCLETERDFPRSGCRNEGLFVGLLSEE